VKYHVYGIEKSRCYTESKGAFNCTTCHNPHEKTVTTPVFYEAKCLSCHTQGKSESTSCPVNPRADCLSCHMPKVRVELHTDFADHWIRARSPFLHDKSASGTTTRPASR
jgi:hypothetical protein